MDSFGDRIAVVTGGGTGIGRAAALHLQADGWDVVVAGRRKEELDKTVAMAKAGGGKGIAFLSTHPSGPDRIRQLEANVPKVQGLYEAARKG